MAVWTYYSNLRGRIRMPRLNGETTTKFLPFRNSIVYFLESTSTTRHRPVPSSSLLPQTHFTLGTLRPMEDGKTTRVLIYFLVLTFAPL